MLLSDMLKKDINSLFLLVRSMALGHLETGLPKDLIFLVLKPLLPNLSKEFTEAILLAWESCLYNFCLVKALRAWVHFDLT